MNVAALILALIGAGLSLFQPVIPYMNIRVLNLLSSGNSDLSSIGIIVLIIACVAVISGIAAVQRKNKTACAAWLAVCGSVLLLSAALFSGNSPQLRNLPFNFGNAAMSVWMKTVFIWALCYLGAAVCVLLDNPSEANTSSASANAAAFTPSSASSPSQAVQPKAKTFEPVLGVETSALIKRAHIFLSENDFDEADRYFEQAVRQDPENSAAYIGKLLAKLRLHNTEELCNVSAPLTEYKFFQYALRFANENEKDEFQQYLEANTSHIEQVKQERQSERQKRHEEEIRKKELEELTKKYDEAQRVLRSGEEHHDSKALYRAAEMFDELGDFNNSKILAESAREKAAQERDNASVVNSLMFIFVFVTIVVIIALNYR